MTLWSDLLASPVVRASWTGGLFVLAVWGICRVFPKLPGNVRCLLWWLATLKLLLALVWTAPLLTFSLPEKAPAPVTQAVSLVNVPAYPRPAVLATPAPASEEVSGGMNAETASALETASAKAVSTEVAAPVSLATALLALWAIGVIFKAGASGAQYGAIRRLIVGATEVNSDTFPGVATAAREASEALKFKRTPRVMVTDVETDPLAVGLWNPVVLIGAKDVERLGPDEMRLLLAHEFSHLRRGDLWMGLVPMLAQNLFFFHPLAWLACREFEVAREAACDADAITSGTTTPRAYGALLIKMGTRGGLYGPASALGMTPTFEMLKRRMTMLENISLSTTGRRRWVSRLALGSLFASATLVGIVPWRIVPEAIAAESVAGAPYDGMNGSSGRKWATYTSEPRNLSFDKGMTAWEMPAATTTDPKLNTFKLVYDAKGYRAGGGSASLVSTAKGAGMLVQYVRADRYRGKRIRLSAYVKTQGGGMDIAALPWLRVDGRKGVQSWVDTEHSNTGNSPWKRREYVVDVPKDAQGLAFGMVSFGKGRAWMDDVAITVVGKEVAVSKPTIDTTQDNDETKMGGPSNLDLKAGLSDWWNDNPSHDAYQNYKIGVKPDGGRQSGSPAGYIYNLVEKPKSYGTFAQNADAAAFHGKRVRYSAYIKTENTDAGGFWVVIHSEKEPGGFNKMGDPIKGTTDWTRYEYVFDVPKDTEIVSFGADLNGKGKLWISDIKWEVVGNEVAVTKEEPSTSGLPAAPLNPNFAQGITGWWNDNPQHNAESNYEISSAKVDGRDAGLLASTVAKPVEYGTLAQNVSPEQYIGKRVRLSAFIRTENTKKGSFWLVRHSPTEPAGWNKEQNPIKGTTGWTKYEYVFEVTKDTEMLAFGASLEGTGKLWMSDVRWEVVGSDVPLTPPSE
jgi:beta-lactamase regulating signal transducer with metallopeptidase domain